MRNLDIKSAQANLDEMIESCIQEHEHFCINSEYGDVVLMSETDYSDIIETINILSIRGISDHINEAIKTKTDLFSTKSPF